MPAQYRLDAVDCQILLARDDTERLPMLALADRAGLSRNTVQARLSRIEAGDVLRHPDCRVDPAALGYQIRAFIAAQVRQRSLAGIAEELASIPEVVEAIGLSGGTDLRIEVVAVDADDLYRVAGRILAIDGMQRTETSLVMRTLVPFRLRPLLQRHAERGR